ncbi:glycoside hydrolase family 75 protein [Streptomyces phaeochromogenes]|uniref:glycoside hydrolase family 75 protein n=1 Tax=Streptomyces phaeochromogenes TaxID=1923 RepID=UPI00386ABADB|nr:glycoside hydrolase family 75 protein [Streptomyces phaeochromogenes]
MRAQSLTLAAAGAALLAPTLAPTTISDVPLPDAVHERAGNAGPPGNAGSAGGVRAADLLAAVRDCVPVSRGFYRTDNGAPADIPVCGKSGAVFWKADLDIDCDGRRGPYCNETTDPLFADTTAFRQSDGNYLSAETLPYVVVPAASHIWNHYEHGVRSGTVAAVIHGDRVQYAVVGDLGPKDLVGEASYATARGLGIRPDPQGGGAASGVTYIFFEGPGVSPIENSRAAVAEGERLARKFIRRNEAHWGRSPHTFR